MVSSEFVFLSLLMVANGIVFFPPSEFILLTAFGSASDHALAAFLLLASANTAGHTILFLLVRRFFLKRIELIMNNQSRLGQTLRKTVPIISKDRNVFWLRLVPVAKTAVSITAALGSIGLAKYLVYTILGNVAFCLVWLAYFGLLSNFLGHDQFVLYVVISILLVYGLHYLWSVFSARKGPSKY